MHIVKQVQYHLEEQLMNFQVKVPYFTYPL